VFKHLAILSLIVLTALYGQAYAQTSGDTRIMPVTGEPQKFDGTRWRVDYAALANKSWAVSDQADLEQTVTGSFSNPNTATFNTFTAQVSGYYLLDYSAKTVFGNGWVRVGSSLGSFDYFDGAAPTALRLYPDELFKTNMFYLDAGEVAHIQMGSGGGSTVIDPSVKVYQFKPVQPANDIAGLESLGGKIHAVYSPKLAGLSDLSYNDRDITPSLGNVTFDTDGNAEFTGGVRADIDTNGDGSGVWVYARVKYDSSIDPTPSFSVFSENPDTYIPLGGDGNTSNQVSRLNNVNNSVDLTLDGVRPANRNEVFDTMDGNWVTVGVENLPNGLDLKIGDNQQNGQFDFNGLLGDMIVLNEAPTAAEFIIIQDVLDDGISILGLPQPNFIKAPIFGGVMVDAAPAWVGNHAATTSTTYTTIETGVDLTGIEKLVFTITQSDGLQTVDGTIDLRNFVFDNPNGALVNWWSNNGIRIRIDTDDVTTGDLQIRALTSAFNVKRIEFRKRAVGVSSRVGEWVFAEPGRTPSQGYLAASGVVVNGAVDYPIAALKHPALVSGNDLDFTGFDGVFLRNTGGNALAVDVVQNDANKAHTHTYQDTEHPGFRPQGNGSNVARQGIANPTHTTSSSGEIEARPKNIAAQLYLIVDTYVEPNSGAANDNTPLNNAVANIITQISNPTIGALTFENFTSLSGGITIDTANQIFNLPQSDEPYVLKAIVGFDFDGTPDDQWEAEWVNANTASPFPNSIEAQFKTFDAGTTTHSQPEYYNPVASVIVDASAGDVPVSFRVTDGATNVDITRVFAEIEQKPSAVIAPVTNTGLKALPLDGGVLSGGTQYLANHTAPINLTINSDMPDLSKIVIEDFSDTTLANTVTMGASSDTFNGATGPLIIDSGTGKYSIIKTSSNTYLWRGDI